LHEVTAKTKSLNQVKEGWLPGVFSLIYTEVAFVGELRWWGFALAKGKRAQG
jgi:hypothetical protein